MKLTVVYITGRKDPCANWALENIEQQIKKKDKIHLIVVDTYNRSPAVLGIRSKRLEDVVVTTPKPSIWQGPHRVTSVDWWANSNARNTGIVLCKTDYIAFLDDRCRLGPRWLETVRFAEDKRKSVVVGSYDKIEDGKRTMDHRRVQCPDGKRDCGGGWLYGCTLALPLNWCLEVNGFEEGCDGLSGEDYIFGYMLQNSGRTIDFVPSLFVELERSRQHVNTFVRADKGVSPNDKSHAALDRFAKLKRTEFTPDLKNIRAQLSRGGELPIPDPSGDHRDWYDSALIREAVAPPQAYVKLKSEDFFQHVRNVVDAIPVVPKDDELSKLR